MLHKIDKALLNKCTKFSAVDEYVLATVFIRNKADLNDLNKYFKVECYEYFEFINALIVRVNKKNIKELTSEDTEKLLQEIRELPTYKYDYKKEYSGETDNYGIIIQDFEDNEIELNSILIYVGEKKKDEDKKDDQKDNENKSTRR